MHLSVPFRCLTALLMLVALSGCRSSGTWNSPTWATSSWNPGTWAFVGATPPSLASKDPSLAAREPYLAKGRPELPSTQASPTQTPSERLAAQNQYQPRMADSGAYPATPASYNSGLGPNDYPSTSGSYPPTVAQPASYPGYPVDRSSDDGVGVGSSYMAPQQNRYAVPATSNDSLSGSGYTGGSSQPAGGGLVNPPSNGAGCRYDTGSDRYGISADTAPRYGNPAPDPYPSTPPAVGNTGYAPPAAGYQPPFSDYQPGNTQYVPGNTGYNPPGAEPYQPAQPTYERPQSGYQPPQPYLPAGGNSTTSTGEPWRPGGTSDYVNAAPYSPSTSDSQVVPTQYIAPEPVR